MTAEIKAEKPVAIGQIPVLHNKAPFLIPPPPNCRRKISDEPFDMNFSEILEASVPAAEEASVIR
jgi:hypothetical protein